MARQFEGKIEQLDANRWRIPRGSREDMRVDGIVYASDRLIADVLDGGGLTQVANVATLPGIVSASMAMPDIHWGYGFPIGGVAATDVAAGGVVSPGGVGYDINCGVRLLRSDLARGEVEPKVKQLVDQIFRDVPCGVGIGGAVKFSAHDMRRVMTEGAGFIVERGYGWPEDLDHTEAGGAVDGADPDAVSKRAVDRGNDQVGTLGAGNHFLEVQVVDEIFDAKAAEAFGVAKGAIALLIHSGSRGFGHQVCDDYLKIMRGAAAKYGFDLPDPQLCCAPVKSDEGRRYLGAMRAAANYAWANRQLLMHLVREAVAKVFASTARDLGLRLVYDVAHNIAKLESYDVGGKRKTLCVHRKGATRAFPAGHPEVPSDYRAVGQPVLIPGDMGRYSFLLVGEPAAMDETFGSVCHGAGRRMSRTAAARGVRGEEVRARLAERGIVARSRSWKGLAEEHSDAYKDVADVVGVVERAGLARRVCRMRPLGVVKG